METNTRSGKARDMVYIGTFAALIAGCSWLMVPSPVPFTLQTLGVFTALGILGGRRGTLAVLTYILLGAVGVPVFAGFSGGIGIILGSTGGYILGFLASALVMWGLERLFGRGRPALTISMAAGLLACYTVGTAWYMAVYTRTTGPVGLSAVLGWCVIPFLIPDLIKISLSLFLTDKLSRFVK